MRDMKRAGVRKFAARCIALAAQLAILVLDDERRRMYLDLVLKSLSEAAQTELRAMDPAKYEYQSDFAKQYIGLGRAEGRAEGELHGRAALLQRLLTPLRPATGRSNRPLVRRHDRRARRHRRAVAQRTIARRSARLTLSHPRASRETRLGGRRPQRAINSAVVRARDRRRCEGR